jgi:hypothetical protein
MQSKHCNLVTIIDAQFLKIAVGNVVATPIRHRIELDTVGELHFVLLIKPLDLLCLLLCLLLCFPSALCLCVPGSRRLSVVDEFVFLPPHNKFAVTGIGIYCSAPSSLQPRVGRQVVGGISRHQLLNRNDVGVAGGWRGGTLVLDV